MKNFFTLTPVLALCVFCLPSVSLSRPAAVPVEERDQLYERLQVLAEAMDIVQKNYVEPVSPKDLVYDAVQGIVSGLDPHSSFMTPEMFHEMQVETEGSFGGLGIEVAVRNGKLVVVSPIEDTPADKAGILAGDEIVMINGESAIDMPLMEAVKLMRGQRGTVITLHIMRDGFETPKEFTLKRDIIKMKSVKSQRIQSIGVVRITQFQQGTDEELRKALDKMSAQGDLDGLVIDLRNNPGGLLDQAIKVTDLFLKSGAVVSTRGRDKEQEVVYMARDDGNEFDLPIVVIVNVGSASASEIVSGALQDHRRALILGERTFGKGSVQTIVPLSDGSGLRVTTALYFTPADRSIQATGIEPDIKVSASASPHGQAAAPHGNIREENLKGHFETPGADKSEPKKSSQSSELKRSDDPQLERAVDILKSWKLFRQMPGLRAENQ